MKRATKSEIVWPDTRPSFPRRRRTEQRIPDDLNLDEKVGDGKEYNQIVPTFSIVLVYNVMSVSA